MIGKITDSSQAAIPNATVRATCGTTAFTTTSDGEGAYLLRLTSGTWQIEVHSTGFGVFSGPVSVTAQVRSSPDIVLAVAREKSDVTVTADAAFVAESAFSASKSDTPILEQPFSIQTVTAAQILQQNVQTLNQAMKYTAGTAPEAYGPDPRGDWFFIRGNAADVYLDGLRLPQVVNSPNSFAAVQVDPNDIQHLEILLGPSSTLYGQSNLGGIVDAVSRQPSLTPRRSIQLQGGNFDRLQVGGDLSGPLNRSASLLYSLNGIARTSHTYVYGAKDDRFTLNPTIQWRPTLNTSVIAFGKFFHTDMGTGAVFLPREGTLDRSPVFGYLPTSFNTGDPTSDHYRKRQYMAGVSFDYHTPSVALHSTTRYVHSNIGYSGRYSATTYANAARTSIYRVTFSSQPVLDGVQNDTHALTHQRTGKLRHTLTGGLDFQWQKYQNRQGGLIDATTFSLINPVYGGPYVVTPITTRVDQKQYQGGLYGQDTVQVAGFTLSAGGRYDQTAQESVTILTGSSIRQRPHAFTGHVGVSYQKDGLAPYASYSTSFLPSIGTTYDGVTPFQPTTGSSYEGGLKYQLPRHVGMITFAGYSMNQNNRLTADPNPLHLNAQVQVGQVRTIGYELQGNGTVLRSLDVSFSYTHARPMVTRSNGADYKKMLQPVAKDTLGLWTHYTVRHTLFTGFGFGGGARYIGPKWGDLANTFQTPGYTLFDGTLDYTMERWRLAVNSTNVLNKRYVSACGTATSCYYGAPRSVIGSVNFSF
ncbi:TonB-dependent siderophore receptor [Terriglobus roseus]|uniref:TonB-dependent siderophore receptor n=1 Tax=Terriglobus roseus TaxID=392734 RepID=UPI0005A2D18E|nr:TonB-dependent siderophore receptor [Terriglobus roseus]